MQRPKWDRSPGAALCSSSCRESTTIVVVGLGGRVGISQVSAGNSCLLSSLARGSGVSVLRRGRVRYGERGGCRAQRPHLPTKVLAKRRGFTPQLLSPLPSDMLGRHTLNQRAQGPTMSQEKPASQAAEGRVENAYASGPQCRGAGLSMGVLESNRTLQCRGRTWPLGMGLIPWRAECRAGGWARDPETKVGSPAELQAGWTWGMDWHRGGAGIQGFRGQRGLQALGLLAGEESRGTLGSWLSLREYEGGPVQVPIRMASGPADEWQMADFPSVPCRWPRPRV